MRVLRTKPFFLLALALALASCSKPQLEPDRERLNLILISLDTCRADRLSCYGYPRPTSPAIDTLAREGVLFIDCLANSTSTAPSHMSIFTGQYPSRHRLLANGGSTIPSHTLADILSDYGWKTAAFTGHGSLQEKFGHGLGFDTFESGVNETRTGIQRFTRNLPGVMPSALSWLDENQEDPFFLFLHGYDPHCPYWAPESWQDKFVTHPVEDFELEGQCGSPYFSEALFDGDFPTNLQYLNDMYDAEIRAADQALGGLFQQLKRRKLFEKTVVIFTSDHGEVLGNHGFVGHTSLWEEEMRIPFVVRFPDKRWQGTRRRDPVQQVDILPTALSALGVPIPGGTQGMDLYSMLEREESVAPDRMRLCEVSDSYSVRFGPRWKLASGSRGEVRRGSADGLYDLENDPAEGVNLVELEQGRAKFEELRARFEAWRHEDEVEGAVYLGEVGEFDPQDTEMLKALGYAGEDD